MLTHSFVGTERAGRATGSGIYTRFPDMRMAVGALGTAPPHLSVTVRLNEGAAKMSIFGTMPLALQHWAEQADVWTLLLICVCALV